jgi:hypothetical protein
MDDDKWEMLRGKVSFNIEIQLAVQYRYKVNVCKEVLAMAAPLFPSQLMLVILKITL